MMARALRFSGTLMAVLAFIAGICLPEPVQAASRVQFFAVDSQREFLEGTLEGIALDPLGRLSLADRVERLADLGEPFLLSAAKHPKGWVVGTGNDGKVLLVESDGTVSTLFSAPEPEIFAVAVASDGTVLAGSSPDGKVYKIRGGETSELFDPGQKYIWDLLLEDDGSLLVATGTEGQLFRVSKAGVSEMIFDSEDTHLKSLYVLRDGNVLIGTAGDGLVLRMDAAGHVRTLYDAAQPEVVDFAEGAGGTAYAALLASEASLVDLSAPGAAANGNKPSTAEGSGTAASGGKVTVTVTSQADQAGSQTGSRPPGFKGPRSEIVRIQPGGSVDTLWSFDSETIYALSWQRQRLWVGTGLEGKVFSLQDGRMVLEKDLDERQVIAVLPGSDGPVYATTNAASLFRSAGEPERTGTFTSPVLDASQTSVFGSMSWVGEKPKGTEVRLSARSGMSSYPDRTWSQWSSEQSGSQVSIADLPVGRYFQWRVHLESGNGDSPELSRVTASYRQQNLPPRIKELAVKAPGEVIVPPGFVPGSQTFEPSRPSREGFFSTLKSSKSERERQRKTLWKKGFRTLEWKAEDPNGDELRYQLSFRPEGSPGSWLPMEDEIEDDFFSFDATALPDGAYRFKLVATDRSAPDVEKPLRSERVSEPVYIDHTAPSVRGSRVESGRLEVEVHDVMSPLADAQFSIDARAWHPAAVSDGLLDGTSETLSIRLPEAGSAQLLLLRASDTAFNVLTIDLSSELP